MLEKKEAKEAVRLLLATLKGSERNSLVEVLSV